MIRIFFLLLVLSLSQILSAQDSNIVPPVIVNLVDKVDVHEYNLNEWNRIMLEKGVEKPNYEFVYPEKKYVSAKIAMYNDLKDIRYNAESDEMEYLDDSGNLYSLNKRKGLLVEFSDKRNFLLTKYRLNNTEYEGYLQVLTDLSKDIKLYKLVSAYEIAVDRHPYNNVSGISYSKSINYLITHNNIIEKLPNTVSKIDKSLNYKVKDIVKDYNLNLKKEADLIKLVDLLNK